METIDQIKIDEGGYQAEVYLCTSGKLTWLYGRNITDMPITKDEYDMLYVILKVNGTQKDWADALFRKEIKELYRSIDFSCAISFQNMPESARNIILNMAYNMGFTKFNSIKWPNFFRAIIAEDYRQAATEGRDSKWFHQVGQRSVRLMNSLENVK